MRTSSLLIFASALLLTSSLPAMSQVQSDDGGMPCRDCLEAGQIHADQRYLLAFPGLIVMWSGTLDDIPNGWALCNGEDGRPDLRDRFVVGAGNRYNIDDTGGTDEVTLTSAQGPRHQHHTFDPDTPEQDRWSGWPWLSIGGGGAWMGLQGGNQPHQYNTGFAGEGQPHENRPPFYALAFIIKVGEIPEGSN